MADALSPLSPPEARDGSSEPQLQQTGAVIQMRLHGKLQIVIVGGGFGGIAAARSLRRCDAEIVLIDRRNHHIFQPLLYQVARAVLAPSEVAAPIRQLSRRQQNISVILAGRHARQLRFDGSHLGPRESTHDLAHGPVRSGHSDAGYNREPPLVSGALPGQRVCSRVLSPCYDRDRRCSENDLPSGGRSGA